MNFKKYLEQLKIAKNLSKIDNLKEKNINRTLDDALNNVNKAEKALEEHNYDNCKNFLEIIANKIEEAKINLRTGK